MFLPARRILLLAFLVTPQVRAQERFITEWLVRGPLPADTGRAGVLQDYLGGEATTLPDSGSLAAGGLFQRIRADSLGRVDLNGVAGPSDWSAAYLHTYLFAPTERAIVLIMDSDDDLVAILNGQRIWVHVVPRGIGLGRDSVRIRLAQGWNSLFLKVINRTGGFGALGKLAPARGDGGVDDIRLAVARPATALAHNRPATTVSVGPLRVAGIPRWRGGRLYLSAQLPVTVWGPDTLTDVSVALEQGRDTWVRRQEARLPPGKAVAVDLEATFEQLRRSATGEHAVISVASWRGGRPIRSALFVDPDPLLRIVESRIAIFDPMDTLPVPAMLGARLAVPRALGGRAVELFTRGLGPASVVHANGRRRDASPVVLCAPCAPGDSIAITVRPDPTRPLWMVPYVRVREPGYAVYADAHRYATALATTPPAIHPPDPNVWLAALGTARERALLADYDAGLRAAAAAARSDTLLLIGNSHIDAAWLWRWQETVDVIRNTWRTSLKLADLFPGYVFTGSSAAYYDALDRVAPGLADSIARAAERGSWAPVGGWWVEADMNMPSGESLARQGLYGQRYFARRFGRRSRVAWTPDSFGYPWSIPQILVQSGFDFFVTQKIRWSDSTEFPYNAFIWEGLDGTRIFSYNPYGYVHSLNPMSLVEQRLEDRERTGGHYQLVLYGVGDHGGGPTIGMLQRAEDLRRVPTFPAMRYSAPLPALQAVAGGQAAERFPVWRDELYLEYHRGTYTSQAAVKRRHRWSESLLQIAEALAAVDTAPYPRDRLERAWRLVLFNQFHDILPGSSIDSVYPDVHAGYDTAWAVLDTVTTAALARLGARMDTRGGRHLVVFNPLGWTRSGRVGVADPARGDTAWRWVRDVPALGARAMRPGDARTSGVSLRAGADWIENDFLRVEVDTLTGTIVRLYDKASGREVLAGGGYANRLQVLDDRPAQWDAWNVMSNPEIWTVDAVERVGSWTDERASYLEVVRRWGDSRFAQRLVLRPGEPFLDVENEVDWHERRKLLKVAFAFDVRSDSASYEIPYGVIGRSGMPRTQAERAKFEVPGQRWADVSQADYGVSILNDGKYGWDYRAGVLRLSLLKAPVWPDSTADRGRHQFRFAIYPHRGDWRQAATIRRAAEYNVPLIAEIEPPHHGELGREFSLASVEEPNAQIAWIKRAEDSDAYVLRLVEWHGRSGPATIQLGCDIRSAARANLLEDETFPLEWRGNRVDVTLRPHEIATIIVGCE